jgi:nitroreductase
MPTLSRRLFLASGAALAALLGRPGAARETANVSIRQAFEQRRSTRLYAAEPIDADTMIELLFAANGVNRPEIDGRTAPSWHGARDVEIYVAQSGGVDWFNARANTLVRVLDEDIRVRTSPEPFVGKAPAVLVYVSDLTRLRESAASFEAGQPEDVTARQHEIAAFVDTAVIAQNVYLFCAAEGLGTCLVGGADPAAIGEALNLKADQQVTYVQPVGYPAD